jgi:hypothetical protein
MASNEEDVVGWVLDDRSREIAKRVEPLFAENEETASTARRLELLASLHYLARRGRINPDDHEAARAQLARDRKHFSNNDIADAIKDLRQVGLL